MVGGDDSPEQDSSSGLKAQPYYATIAALFHSPTTVVVFGALNKEACRLGRVLVIAAALREQSEGDERVKQHSYGG